jgi:hypothetical protein
MTTTLVVFAPQSIPALIMGQVTSSSTRPIDITSYNSLSSHVGGFSGLEARADGETCNSKKERSPRIRVGKKKEACQRTATLNPSSLPIP